VRLPALGRRAGLLLERVVLEKEIFARIERDGRVADNASPELAQLRDRYRIIHDQIHAVLEKTLAAPEYDELLQDKIFTLRNGRFVVPVRVERRHAVDGIVHDISHTGQSLFIEPRPITDLNNRLRTTELEIEREIYRILLELTYKVGECIDELVAAADVLAALDVVFAKARYAELLNAHPVEVARPGDVTLPQVRHPLLVESIPVVIANDVAMEAQRTLVLSGPNTGGKTVLLKTIGLCALMLRAGLHVPCGAGGRLPVFKRIFAVIGDEQSIERNLSSFSSHVLNLKGIIDELVPASLVLIDEIGEGTEPNQGVALAKAVLEDLHAHGARTVVTTHFADLMAEAQIRDGWANAAMAFDDAAMTPTYRLITGSPGRSSAFAIAERLGLPKAIVQRARELASGVDSQLDQVISRLETERQKWAAASQKAEIALAQTELEKQRQQEILAELRQNKRKLIEQEREALKQQIAEAQATIRQVIRMLQEKPSFAAAEQARTALHEAEERVAEVVPPPDAKLPDYLAPIDDWSALPERAEVYVRDLNESAVVLEKPDARGRVKLLVRDKKMTLAAEQCFRRLDLEASRGVDRTGGAVTVAVDAVDENLIRLDLRGQTADDALIGTERFLDQALRLRLPLVTIIHGHGTGVLKRRVRDYLKTCPYAKTWRPGRTGEGGDGVSLVELDL
jgi:DNA mismatch repair protein MutS2